MKNWKFILIFLMVANQLAAQVLKPLQFRDEIYDFGTVVEANGPVTFEFEFTNVAGRPVKILGVKASCGCTTPNWTKDPVQPGKTGFIQARFDPKGRPGYFTKTLTVTTDADAGGLILQIKGTVSSDNKDGLTEFGSPKGNWKMKASALNLGKIFLKDEFVVRDFEIINSGEKAIAYLNKYEGPEYIKIALQPNVLQPGERGSLRLSFNGKLKNQYGFQSDNIVLYTDDDKEAKKSFSVFATLEDYFPALSSAEIAKAPKMRIGEPNVDMGRIKQNQAVVREVMVSNLGKSTLELRSIQGNCECITVLTNKKFVKAGESSVLKISLDPQDRKGTQQKSVTIYSNDPKNPVQRITLAAYVED